jgi:hypothetical protein
MLRLGALVQLRDVAGKIGVRRRGREPFGELDQRDQRFPSLAGRSAGRGLVGQPDLGQHPAYRRGEIIGRIAVWRGGA